MVGNTVHGHRARRAFEHLLIVTLHVDDGIVMIAMLRGWQMIGTGLFQRNEDSEPFERAMTAITTKRECRESGRLSNAVPQGTTVGYLYGGLMGPIRPRADMSGTEVPVDGGNAFLVWLLGASTAQA